VNGSCLRPIGAHWQVGNALLLFAVAGQAFGSATISGKVIPVANGDLGDAIVAATNDKYGAAVYRIDASGGTYAVDVDSGTYTLAVVARNQTAPAVKNLVLKDGDKVTRDFTLATRTPFPVVKSPTPIPLTDGIDSASFMDATEIDLKSGEQVTVGAPSIWGGPTTVSGRFKVKYSSLGIHVAGDVTYKTPRVNNRTEGNIWDGNALEVMIQANSSPYYGGQTVYDKDSNWECGLSLGDNMDWWLWRGFHGGPDTHPTINGKDEAVTSHVMIQDKPAATPGETFRLDIPWAILLDSTGAAISPPGDNELGAMDIALDAADPTVDKASATRAFQLAWSGLSHTDTDPSELVAVQFVPRAPTMPAPTAGE
jgi:hypothetical protein